MHINNNEDLIYPVNNVTHKVTFDEVVRSAAVTVWEDTLSEIRGEVGPILETYASLLAAKCDKDISSIRIPVIGAYEDFIYTLQRTPDK